MVGYNEFGDEIAVTDWGTVRELTLENVPHTVRMSLPHLCKEVVDGKPVHNGENGNVFTLEYSDYAPLELHNTEGVPFDVPVVLPLGINNMEMVSEVITGPPANNVLRLDISTSTHPDPHKVAIARNFQPGHAYDIVLRLGRELLMRGAKVHFIIQDKKDGIRNEAVLKNSKKETCMGKEIPLDQNARLRQRSQKIDQLSKKDKSNYKRAIFVHVDSRSKGKQTDVYFYHAPGSKQGKRLANRMKNTLQRKYKQHQPGRGFNGTVSERNLYVLRNTQPAGVYLELGNIRNSRDQQRLVLENNRQALAKWIAEAIVADYKGK